MKVIEMTAQYISGARLHSALFVIVKLHMFFILIMGVAL